MILNLLYKDWYKESNEAINIIYGDDTNLFIDLLSATSPRKSIKANFNLAHKIYLNVKAGLNPLEVAGLLHAHKNNILRAVNGEELHGEKVKRFALNLKGNLKAVTIDTWILRHFKINKSLTPLQYAKLEKRIIRIAHKNNLEPAEYQAILWEDIRQKHGFKAIDFKSVLLQSIQEVKNGETTS